MSLLLKALQQAERGSELSLEPMESRSETPRPAPPASAQAAAGLMLDKQSQSEKRRILILLGVLVAVVLSMGVYFYLAVFMPWIFLPKPAPIVAPVTVVSPPLASPAQQTADLLASSKAPLATPAPVSQVPATPAQENPAKQKREAVQTKVTVPVIQESPVADTSIQISSGSKSAPGNALLAAYQLLESGHLEEARRAYEALRAQEPQNSDVLLGLGLIAQRQGRSDDAAKYYLKALDLDPKNTFAQASLSAMIARADPSAAEKKLQALIVQQPSAAFLYFRLGNILAAQGRWTEAQKAYFEAQRLENDAPDYAFNLAVSLERIQQPRAALEYYQRALRLAQGKPTSFDPGLAKARVQALGAAN